MQPPQNYTNLFLDMNAFFASVEQQVQPKLRGQPICVAPYTGSTGCCIAKSYEAKAFGIQTGNLVGEARKLCPQIIILEARPELYLFYHQEIKKVLDNLSPQVTVLSVDEFNLRLTGSECSPEASRKLALEIKTQIKEKVGDYLSCSVGIGPNKWLSKLAGELKKPNGLVMITLQELEMLYRSLNLTDLPGINIALARRLKTRKISTPFDFYLAPIVNLSCWFGHPGRLWFYRLRGYETDDFISKTQSISHEHVLAPLYRTLPLARAVLIKMTQKCGHRLRAGKFQAGAVAVRLNFLDRTFWDKHIRTDLVSDSQSLERIAIKIFDTCRLHKKPLKVAVTFYDLVKSSQGRQISLLADLEKSRKLSQALDIINDKYGLETIHPATILEVLKTAPRRISFGDPERF